MTQDETQPKTDQKPKDWLANAKASLLKMDSNQLEIKEALESRDTERANAVAVATDTTDKLQAQIDTCESDMGDLLKAFDAETAKLVDGRKERRAECVREHVSIVSQMKRDLASAETTNRDALQMFDVETRTMAERRKQIAADFGPLNEAVGAMAKAQAELANQTTDSE